jgi:hypothetical protein
MFKRSSFSFLTSVAAFAFFTVHAQTAHAQTVVAPGFIHSFQTLSDTTQSCVASAPGGTFVGQGPGFTGNAQSVVFVSESGDERTVVSGFNSIGDCVYNSTTDVLYIVDNAREAAGSTTGDTAYAIPDALTASGLTASAFELKPDGSIPGAFSVALDSSGNIYVSDATGSGNGTVRRIAASNSAMTTFATGFDYTGGLIWDAAGDLFVAESLDSFDAQISRYNASGVFQEVVSGPTFMHGSFDLALNVDGRLLVTGAFNGPLVAIDPATGDDENVANGFSFATSIDVDDFTGRIELVSSTFIGEDEDYRLHALTPIALLTPDGGKSSEVLLKNKQDCITELYGIELSINEHGKLTKEAICHDGAPCDADGAENGSCTFPLGVCVNVDDDRTPLCFSDSVDSVQLKAKPDNAALSALVSSITAAAPIDDAACFFSDGIEVPIGVSPQGNPKAGRQIVKLKTTSSSPLNRKDADSVRLICEPS